MLGDDDKIVSLTDALVINARRCADTPKVRARRAVSECEKCARKRGDDLIVASAPLEWMWMRDQRKTATPGARIVQRDVDRPDRAVDQQGTERGRMQ